MTRQKLIIFVFVTLWSFKGHFSGLLYNTPTLNTDKEPQFVPQAPLSHYQHPSPKHPPSSPT